MPRRIRYDAWLRADGRLRHAHELSTWTSPWCEPGFTFTELVASWSATTPRGTWLEVATQARGSRAWHDLGHWSSGTRPTRRTSVVGDPEVDTDVWRPRGGAEVYRLRVSAHGAATVHRIGAVVSAGATRSTTSPPVNARGVVLGVPRLSQMTYREIGGAGWCAPTAVSMVLAHVGRLPPGTDVPAAARATFDPAYDGTGNWSFDVAWAATLADHAFVTRLRDLRDAEQFVAAGIPLVASVAYPRGALKGAPTHGTDGHLLVIRGFTDTGDVVVNDPAAPTERSVRRTYERAELERAWLDGSGGTVFVIHGEDRALPVGGRGAW